MGNFRTTLIQLSQDQLIDRADYARLKEVGAEVQTAKKPKADDAWMAKQVLAYLDNVSATTRIRYGIPGQTLDFMFTPAYSESDRIPGETTRAKLSQVSQRDNLAETNDDYQRCGSASLINAFLLLGGDFADAAKRLKLDPKQGTELTYANLHRAQEALFDFANTDGATGLSSQVSYSYIDDKIVSVTLGGEVTAALDKLGLKGEALLGKSIDNRFQRTETVQAFWKAHPDGILMTGVYLDTQTGALRSPSKTEPQNHFVTVFKDKAGHYMLDTGASDNGRGNSLHTLSAAQIEGLVNQTTGHVIGVTKGKKP